MADINEVVVHGSAAGFAQEILAGRHPLTADEPVAAGGTDAITPLFPSNQRTIQFFSTARLPSPPHLTNITRLSYAVSSAAPNKTIRLELHLCSESENDSALPATSHVRVILDYRL